jgi:hypothetical protein
MEEKEQVKEKFDAFNRHPNRNGFAKFPEHLTKK